MEQQEETRKFTFAEKMDYLANKVRVVIGDEGVNPATDDDGKVVEGMNLLKDRMKRMKAVQTAYDTLKPVLDELNAEYDKLRKKVIPDLASENEVRSVTVEGVGRLQLTGDCYASIPPEQQEAAFAWFRSHTYGDLIKETVHSATLKAWAKEMLEAGRVPMGDETEQGSEAADTAASVLGIEKEEGPEKLPVGMFRIEPFTRASIVKVKGK